MPNEKYNLYLNNKLVAENIDWLEGTKIINDDYKYRDIVNNYVIQYRGEEKYYKGSYINNWNERVKFRLVKVTTVKNNIKSLSISVPATGCVNDCKYCVSKMKNDWKCFGTDDTFLDDVTILEAMHYAIENGAKSIIITGTVEPLQNMEFVHRVCKAFKKINPPTVSLEIQTSLCYGAMTIPYIKKLAEWGVDTLAVSISALKDEDNWELSGITPNRYASINSALQYAKKLNMNIRICTNLSKKFFKREIDPEIAVCTIIKNYPELADQITLRRLYHDGSDTAQANWIKENEYDDEWWEKVKEYLNGGDKDRPIYKISEIDYYEPFNNLYIRVDEDCMGKQDESRYWVLRPDGKLYQGWDATTPIDKEK